MIESLGESCIIFESTIQALVVSIRSCNYPISGSFCRVTLKFWKALKPCFGIWCEALELDRLTKFKACAQSPPRIFYHPKNIFFFITVCWREAVCSSCRSDNSLVSFHSPVYPRLLPFYSTSDQVTVMWLTTFSKLSAAPLCTWRKLHWSCRECYEKGDSGI